MTNQLRVVHFPQIPCKPFWIEVATVDEALKVADTLAFYDLFLLKNGHRVDYSNSTLIEHSDPWGDGEPGSFDPDNADEMEELRSIVATRADRVG